MEDVAQLVEREPEELRVGGSTPSNLTKNKKMQLYLVIKNNLLIFALENNTIKLFPSSSVGFRATVC